MNKQTIVILEGHDNSGKSHIAKVLSKELEIPIFKMNRNKYFWDYLSHQTYATEAITQMLEQTGVSVILDRSFVSDYMYSKLFKRDYIYEKGFDTDARFAKMDALIVVCYKKETSFTEDIEDKAFITVEDYDKMTIIYKHYCLNSLCRYIFIDTSDEDIAKQITTIKKYI